MIYSVCIGVYDLWDEFCKKKEKKIHIKIKFLKIGDNKYNIALVTKRPYEGVPTFNDITNFQKKIQEDISNYIKKCQNPKDIS